MEGLNLSFCKQKCFSEYSPALVTPTCDGTFSDLRLPQVVFFTILSDFGRLAAVASRFQFSIFSQLVAAASRPKTRLATVPSP